MHCGRLNRAKTLLGLCPLAARAQSLAKIEAGRVEARRNRNCLFQAFARFVKRSTMEQQASKIVEGFRIARIEPQRITVRAGGRLRVSAGLQDTAERVVKNSNGRIE